MSSGKEAPWRIILLSGWPKDGLERRGEDHKFMFVSTLCIHRLEVTPAYLDQSMAASPMTTPCRWNDTRQDKQLYFPLMTYWPIDLWPFCFTLHWDGHIYFIILWLECVHLFVCVMCTVYRDMATTVHAYLDTALVWLCFVRNKSTAPQVAQPHTTCKVTC